MARQAHDRAFAGLSDLFEALEPRALMSYSLAAAGPEILSRTDGITSTIAADYDGDGMQDLLVASGRDVLMLRGDGLGRFAPAVTVATLQSQVGLLALGRDSTPGHLDLFAAQSNTRLDKKMALRRLIGGGENGFAIVNRTILTGRATALVLAREAGHALPDVVLTRAFAPTVTFGTAAQYALHMFRPQASGAGFDEPSSAIAGLAQIGTPAVFDVNGDGTDEVIVPTSNPSGVYSVPAAGHIRLFVIDNGLSQLGDVSVVGAVTRVTVANIGGGGAPSVFFATYGIQGSTWFQKVTGIPLFSIDGVPGMGAPGPVHARSQQTTQAAVDYRVIGIEDMNGDGRMDLVTSTVFGSFPTTGSFGQTVLLSQLIQGEDGTFTESTVRTTTGSVYFNDRPDDLGELDALEDFTIVRVRSAAGGGTARPEIVMLDRPAFVSAIPQNNTIGRTSLTFLKNISAFRSPQVAAMRTGGIPGGGQPTAGRGWFVGADIAIPDMSRGVGITSVQLFRDSNGNGVLDGADEMVSTGVRITTNPTGNLLLETPGQERWRMQFVIQPSWNLGDNTFFVRVTDTRGMTNDTSAARPVLHLV